MKNIRLILLFFMLCTWLTSCSNDDEMPPLADFLYQTTWESDAQSYYKIRYFFLNKESVVETVLGSWENASYFKYYIEKNVISIDSRYWFIEERTKNTMTWVCYEYNEPRTLYLKKVSPKPGK